MKNAVNINDVLGGHVSTEIDCIDRLYLNAYIPNLQVGPQVNHFLERHLGLHLGSPAIIEKIGNRFRREVKAFAEAKGIPIIQLKKPDRSRWDDRKLDHVRPHLDKAEYEGRFGVVRPGVPVGLFGRQADRSWRWSVLRLREARATGRNLLLLSLDPPINQG
jgi:hypothetical protein